eukprot:350593-Chlamydomonas_euryale.AAC.8
MRADGMPVLCSAPPAEPGTGGASQVGAAGQREGQSGGRAVQTEDPAAQVYHAAKAGGDGGRRSRGRGC